MEFSPVTIWQIGEENVVEYTLPFGYEEAENDWIGVYKVHIHIYYLRLKMIGNLNVTFF